MNHLCLHYNIQDNSLWDLPFEAVASASTVQTLFFPADHAIISKTSPLVTTPGPSSAYLAVYKDDHTFGIQPLRKTQPEASNSLFYASLDNGSRITVRAGPSYPKKPDKHNSALLSYTLPVGLTVTVGTDGSVRMEYVVGTAVAVPAAARVEVCRIIKVSASSTREEVRWSSKIF